MTDPGISSFREVLERNRSGETVGVYSVCSSHPYAIRAALSQAREDQTFALIESTSNQVNQLGGYTGMKPDDFVRFVYAIADEMEFPRDYIVFGGDHLGPFPWHSQTAEVALALSRELVGQYAHAGFTKIHLDVSMYLGDDERVQGKALPPEIVAARTAELCAVSERVAEDYQRDGVLPLYVIGNEVPVPGGTSAEQGELRPTLPEDLRSVVECMKEEFRLRKLESAWDRVIAVVVQPGVEFGDNLIHDYDPSLATDLVGCLSSLPTIVYEAHSTDYQLVANLRRLVADHFAILKVGPALTFAFREAVFALDAIDRELNAPKRAATPARLVETVMEAMEEDDRYWRSYYTGSEEEIATARRYSYSDRIRYYWTSPKAVDAFRRLRENLESTTIPLSLLSQFLPTEYSKVRSGELTASPDELILSHIRDVTRAYSTACISSDRP